MMLLCVADNARLAFVNRVNAVNLSTNLKNPAANMNARVLCPVPLRMLQGPHYRTKAKSMTRLASLEEQY